MKLYNIKGTVMPMYVIVVQVIGTGQSSHCWWNLANKGHAVHLWIDSDWDNESLSSVQVSLEIK